MEKTLIKTHASLQKAKAEAVHHDRAVTPRPDWEDTRTGLVQSNVIGEETQLDVGASSVQIAQTLKQLIVTIRNTIIETRQQLNEVKAQENGQPAQDAERARLLAEANDKGEGKKWLLCLGKGRGIPEYMQATGKVPNKNFTRTRILMLLNNFWAAKGKTAQTLAQPMSDFFHKWLQAQFGVEREKIVATYNLMFGITRFSFDAGMSTPPRSFFTPVPQRVKCLS